MNLSAHASRWLIVIILAPLLAAIIWAGPRPVFDLIIVLAGLMAWWEFSDICFGRERKGVMLLGMCGILLIMQGARLAGGAYHQLALIGAVSLGCLYFLLNYEKIPSIIDQAGRFVLGQVWVGFFLSFFLLLFTLGQGRRWVLFALIVTFLGDTAAFYVGRSWGRRPLASKVSPGKTMAGFWAGLAGSGLTAAVSAWFLLPVAWYEAGIFGVLLGLTGVMGDLFESMFKRWAGVKDSGRVLLGHGGLLDRIDALLFNVPLVYFFAVMVGGRG